MAIPPPAFNRPMAPVPGAIPRPGAIPSRAPNGAPPRPGGGGIPPRPNPTSPAPATSALPTISTPNPGHSGNGNGNGHTPRSGGAARCGAGICHAVQEAAAALPGAAARPEAAGARQRGGAQAPDRGAGRRAADRGQGADRPPAAREAAGRHHRRDGRLRPAGATCSRTTRSPKSW